jgi:hypothetical protein
VKKIEQEEEDKGEAGDGEYEGDGEKPIFHVCAAPLAVGDCSWEDT